MYRARSKHSQKRTKFRHAYRRWLLITGATVVALFVVANVSLAILYSNRTYPDTKVMGTAVGSVKFDQLSAAISSQKILPSSIIIQKNDQKVKVQLDDLGVSKDIARTVSSAKKQRSWLPLANLFKSPQLEAPVKIDRQKLASEAQKLAKTFNKEAQPAHLLLKQTTVSIVDSQAGYSFDGQSLQSAIIKSLDRGQSNITAPVKIIAASKSGDLKAQKTALEAELQTAISFKYGSKVKQANSQEIADLYSPSGNGYAIDNGKLLAYLSALGVQFGIHIKDADATANSVKSALTGHKASTVTITAQIAIKTYNYCVAVRGVDASNLAALRSKLKSTYADSRGWSLDGLVDFKEVTSGCDYTVWLSAASQMASFGGVCDPQWSCRSGNNVVFNYDRWAKASDAWNQYGGSLEDYRSMLVNHETGHRLGFGHRHCGGPGQLAPVMQQQSISLEGCTFNPWPLPVELSALRSTLGI